MRGSSSAWDYTYAQRIETDALLALEKARQKTREAEQAFMGLLQTLPPNTALVDGQTAYWLRGNGDIAQMKLVEAYSYTPPTPAPQPDDCGSDEHLERAMSEAFAMPVDTSRHFPGPSGEC